MITTGSRHLFPAIAALIWTGSAVPAESYLLSHGALRLTIETSTARNEAEFGPRFDRTAMVTSLTVHGQELLGPWGLCDEFGLYGDGVLGYTDAAVGEHFVKIGVGALVRDRGDAYHFSHPYPVKSAFHTAVSTADEELTIRQDSDPTLPYRYSYRKSYALGPKNTLAIHYRLSNTGDRPWTFEHYNHHWFRLRGVRVGPAYRLVTGFELPEAPTGFSLQSGELRPPRTLRPGEALYYASELAEVAPADNRFALSISEGAMLHYSGWFPPARFALYASEDGFCPEVFFRSALQPGETVDWSATYRFELRPQGPP